LAASGSVDGAINSPAAQQRLVSSSHDRVDLLACDVTQNYLDHGHT
jgi:hypothetical protein